jgi:hypothetical protein
MLWHKKPIRFFGSSGIPVVNSQTAQAIFSNIDINHEVITVSLRDNLEKPREFLMEGSCQKAASH